VVIDWDDPAVVTALPDEAAISADTLAELAAGTHLASTVDERARRRARPQQVEATFDAIGFDGAAARSHGQVVAAVVAIGRSHRRRIADLLIAATAHANGLPLHTRNPDDFDGLGRLIEIIGVGGGTGRRSRP
jgi:predicted nucleic acid-binding protein